MLGEGTRDPSQNHTDGRYVIVCLTLIFNLSNLSLTNFITRIRSIMGKEAHFGNRTVKKSESDITLRANLTKITVS